MNTRPRCQSSGTEITTSDPCPSRYTSATSSDHIAITPTAPSASRGPKSIGALGAVPSALTARPAHSPPQPSAPVLALMWYVRFA